MLSKRLAGVAHNTSIFNLPSYWSIYKRPILRSQLLSRVAASFSSTSASNAESQGDTQKFHLRDSDGKRLSASGACFLFPALPLHSTRNTASTVVGSEFFDLVKKIASKEEKEDFAVPTPAFEALLAEYDTLINEGLEWEDKYKRSLAETENVRKRGFKQTEEAKVFAIQGFCKDLLEVADVLDIAVDSVKEEQLKAGDKTLVDLHQGIVMTRTVLLNTFKKHGLVPVNPMGEKFDPNLHEAVFQVPPGPEAKAAPGHIMHVSKIGYSLKNRPVRAAQVGVVIES